MNIEPFGYFKADVCGWTDCHDDDEGAMPLWDNAALLAIEKQRDELLEEVIRLRAALADTEALEMGTAERLEKVTAENERLRSALEEVATKCAECAEAIRARPA